MQTATKEQGTVLVEIKRFRGFSQAVLNQLKYMISEAESRAKAGTISDTQRVSTRKGIAQAKELLDQLDTALDSQPSEVELIEAQIKELKEKRQKLLKS